MLSFRARAVCRQVYAVKSAMNSVSKNPYKKSALSPLFPKSF